MVRPTKRRRTKQEVREANVPRRPQSIRQANETKRKAPVRTYDVPLSEVPRDKNVCYTYFDFAIHTRDDQSEKVSALSLSL